MTFEEYSDSVYEKIWFEIAENITDYLKDAWDAAYKQAYNDAYADAAYPIGYVLVPVEPTEKMFWAGDTALNSKPWGNMTSAYKAMIQAAQEKE